MPSSLIVVALVVAWLVVLVPMVVRKRQEIAKTADSTLSGRVLRAGEQSADSPADQFDDDYDYGDYAEYEDGPELPAETRRYRPGRGGYDPDAAARAARAKYAYRQRIVVLLFLSAVGTVVAAATVTPWLWWVHGVVDIALVAYLAYLRRQVRIEDEIRRRRLARMAPVAPTPHRTRPEEPVHQARVHPTAVPVDVDDEDPWFEDLGDPHDIDYRRAVGE